MNVLLSLSWQELLVPEESSLLDTFEIERSNSMLLGEIVIKSYNRFMIR